MNAAMYVAYMLENDPNLLVPISSLTEQAHQALWVLSEAIKSVPEGPFRDFLNNSVVYNVEVLGGVSDGILIGENPRSIGKGSSLVDIGTDSLVYIRHSIPPLVGGIYYVGSTTNGYSRIMQHKASMSGTRYKESIHEKLYSIGCDVGFSEVYRSINYYHRMLRTMPGYNLSEGEVWILKALTEFISRVLEQSLITEHSPGLNTPERPVLFSYNSWDASLLEEPMKTSDSAIPVQVMNADTGEVLVARVPSISTVCLVLGINRTVVDRLLHSGDIVYSDTFNCNVVISVVDGVTALTQYAPLTLVGGPLTSLADYVVWAFESDKMTFEGPFRSFSEAARELNPTSANAGTTPNSVRKAMARLCNSNTMVHTEVGAYYIACNPNTRPTSTLFTARTHPMYGKPLPKTPFES